VAPQRQDDKKKKKKKKGVFLIIIIASYIHLQQPDSCFVLLSISRAAAYIRMWKFDVHGQCQKAPIKKIKKN
jgi:hypothetical protein